MISLSDTELDIVMAAAAPLLPQSRDAFLRAVAGALAQHPQLGPGIVCRIAREMQRRHFSPPEIIGTGSKHGRPVGGAR